MKRILVTAGGTATAWHIVQVAKRYFDDKLKVYIADTNDPWLVAAGKHAEDVFKIPPVLHSDYREKMREICKGNHIDCVVPLLPQEGNLFAQDAFYVKELGIKSVLPKLSVIHRLTDKREMYETLTHIGIPTPRIYTIEETEDNKVYILKPRIGFGSRDVFLAKGSEIKERYKQKKDLEKIVIQEYCSRSSKSEVTVEVFNGEEQHIFSRYRMEVKSGACTKAMPANNEAFEPFVSKLVREVECPRCFNVQFVFDGKLWKLMDCNLRLGAGSALSSAFGFQLTRAMLADIAGMKVDESFFQIDKSIKEVIIR